MSRQIYVGRLGSKIRREDLQQEFEKYGKIKDIDLRSTHAFIEFEASDEAKQAISQVDGRRIGGDRVTVKQRDDRPSGVRGPTTRDVCFNCGRKGHWANECKEGDLRETCYRCYKKGHIKRNVPCQELLVMLKDKEEIEKEEDHPLHLNLLLLHQNLEEEVEISKTDKIEDNPGNHQVKVESQTHHKHLEVQGNQQPRYHSKNS